MGKVFTPDELAGGQVPDRAGFIRVRDYAVQQITESKALVGGLICGSVLRNEHNSRSDFDLLVCYHHCDRPPALSELFDIMRLAKSWYVPVEIIPFDIEMLESTMHSLGNGFRKHLKWAEANGGIIKRNPLDFVEGEPLTIEEDIQGYFRHKLAKLLKGEVGFGYMDTPEQYHYLQKILESPERAMRKWLEYYGIDTGSAGKRQTVQMYRDHPQCPDAGWAEKLFGLDVAYSEEMIRQLNGETNLYRYGQVIDTIISYIPEFIGFFRKNALMLA